MRLGESGTASLRLVLGVLPSLTVRTPLSIKIVSPTSEARDHTGVLNRTSDPDLGGISHPAPSELMNSGDPDGYSSSDPRNFNIDCRAHPKKLLP